MFKRTILTMVMVVLPLSVKAEVNYLGMLWEIWDQPAKVLPEFWVTGPLNLSYTGVHICNTCGDLSSVFGKQTVVKFAANKIFGANRVANKKHYGYVFLAPYKKGVHGLKIRVGSRLIEIRVAAMNDDELKQLASPAGGVIKFFLVASDGTATPVHLVVRFNQDFVIPTVQIPYRYELSDAEVELSNNLWGGESVTNSINYTVGIDSERYWDSLYPLWNPKRGCHSINGGSGTRCYR
jgi:hypothetical protein